MPSGSKRVAIVQSNYIPWKGYFDLIGLVDEFILYDDRQYTKRDWRNRNLIKTPQGLQWLTIPVAVKGRYFQRIDETEVSDSRWAASHWGMLVQNYARAAHFAEYRAVFEGLYLSCDETSLSRVNRRFIESICRILGITTKISWSTDYRGEGTKTGRLVSLCRQAGATLYLSGPAAKAYLDEDQFVRADIELAYTDYGGYPEYPQLYPSFEHRVTVLDLIFNTGARAVRYLKSTAQIVGV